MNSETVITRHECTFWYNRVSRRSLLEVGGRYTVLPLVPTKKKHRGRVCTLVEFLLDKDTTLPDRQARVRWDDTGRLGHVEIADLVPLTEES